MAAVAVIPDKQRFKWRLVPGTPDALLNVETVGGTLKAVGALFRAFVKQDDPKGRKWTVSVVSARMDEADGSIEFELAVLPTVTPGELAGEK